MRGAQLITAQMQDAAAELLRPRPLAPQRLALARGQLGQKILI